MRRTALSMTLAFGAVALAATARADDVKVAVVPLAPLSGQVPLKAGTKAANLLAGELKNVGGVLPIEVALEQNDAAIAGLAQARQAIGEAQELEKKRKFGAAAAAARKALQHFDAGASLVEDVGELSDAHVLLAKILYLTGDDVGGAKELWNAISLTPTRELPGEKSSPLFAAEVKRVREKLLAADKAKLRVESVPAGAPVLLDGQEVGRTPLELSEIPPGKHLWSVQIPTSAPIGGIVTLVGGKPEKVVASINGPGPVSVLNAALASNSLDDKAAGALKQIAEANGSAELVVFGTLHQIDENLVFSAFTWAADKGISRINPLMFDSEMLSAGMELFKLAGELGAKKSALGQAQSVPAAVASAVGSASNAKLTEVAYVVPGTEQKEEVQEKTRRPAVRRPIDKRAVERNLRPRDK